MRKIKIFVVAIVVTIIAGLPRLCSALIGKLRSPSKRKGSFQFQRTAADDSGGNNQAGQSKLSSVRY